MKKETIIRVVLMVIIIISFVLTACTGTGGAGSSPQKNKSKKTTEETTKEQHTPKQPSKDWMSVFIESGLEVEKADPSKLYSDAEEFLGKTIWTVTTADAMIITGKTIKSKTSNNTTMFYSLIFEFENDEIRDLDIQEDDKVAVVGTVSEISTHGSVTLKNCHILATGAPASSYKPSSEKSSDTKETKKSKGENDLGKSQKMEGIKFTVKEFTVTNHMRGKKKFPRATDGFKYVTVYLDVHNTTTSSVDFTTLILDDEKYVFTLRYNGGIDYNESYCESKEFLRYYDDLPAQGTYKDLAICFEVPASVAEQEGNSIELILSKNKIITTVEDVTWTLQ